MCYLIGLKGGDFSEAHHKGANIPSPFHTSHCISLWLLSVFHHSGYFRQSDTLNVCFCLRKRINWSQELKENQYFKFSYALFTQPNKRHLYLYVRYKYVNVEEVQVRPNPDCGWKLGGKSSFSDSVTDVGHHAAFRFY